jgi:hypothetical protein
MIGLNKAKNNALAEVVRDIGSILFASLFIGPFLADKVNLYVIVFGFLLAILAWILGIRMIHE